MNDSGTPRMALLMLLAFLSGCCALAYEVLYLRALTTLLGDMLHVHAALLSTFLIGIGLGAKVAHRWLRGLWLLEALTGLYALTFPLMAQWFSGLPVMIAVTGSPSLTILTTAASLSLPSLMIGFSIPLFSAYLKAMTGERQTFQYMYAVYNLGAFFSVLTVELLLVRAWGVRFSLAAVGTVNLMNAVALLTMRAAPTRVTQVAPRHFTRRVVFALALASVVSAVFQVFVLKLSYLLFSPHRENFAVAVSVTLLGIFLGALLAARTRIRFETCLLLFPLLVGGIYASWVPLVHTHQWLASLAQRAELLILLEKLAVLCLFALGPMILFGAMLPALMRSEQEVAGESGHLLFVSSLANAAGYLLYVLVGHPLLPTHALLALLAGSALVSSVLATDLSWSRVQRGLALAGVALVAVAVVLWREPNFYLAQAIDGIDPEDEIVTFKSGSDNVTLVRRPEFEWISYNGQASIHPQLGGFPRLGESLSGVIPALSAPRTGRALVLGFGAGITAGTTSLLFEQTDVVEINAAFYEMMPHMASVNLDIEHNPTVTLHLADARAFLIGKEGQYDAIVNAVSAPTYFSASKIYTVEFYQRAKRALKPDGIFATWLAVPDMSEEGLLLVLSALHRTFRYCDLNLMHTAYYTTTCSDQPIRVRRFSDLAPDPRIIGLLRGILRIFDPDELFEDIRISENLFDHFEPQVLRENTDDHPVLEFVLVRNLQRHIMGSEVFLEHQELFNIDPARLHEGPDASRLFRRAALFARFDRRYYERNFVPLMERGIIPSL